MNHNVALSKMALSPLKHACAPSLSLKILWVPGRREADCCALLPPGASPRPSPNGRLPTDLAVCNGLLGICAAPSSPFPSMEWESVLGQHNTTDQTSGPSGRWEGGVKRSKSPDNLPPPICLPNSHRTSEEASHWQLWPELFCAKPRGNMQLLQLLLMAINGFWRRKWVPIHMALHCSSQPAASERRSAFPS